MANTQTPITYPVSTAPTRIAGFHNPPFRIINNNVTGTVWISDNPGIKAGEGTPLHAGTSLRWLTKTELWIIADVDDLSIIVTNEIDDWQPDPTAVAAAIFALGIPIVYQRDPLYSGNIGGPNPSLITLLPTIPINSFELFLSRSPVAGTDFFITVTTYKDGLVIQTRIIRFSSPSQRWSAVMPCPEQPDTITISIGGIAPFPVFFVSAVGSTAPRSQLLQNPLPTTGFGIPYGYLVQEFVASIAGGGGTHVFIVPPWFGEIEVRFFGTQAAAGNITLLGRFYEGITGTLRANQLFLAQAIVLSGATRASMIQRLNLSGSAYHFTIQNDTAAALSNTGIEVVPVSGGWVI